MGFATARAFRGFFIVYMSYFLFLHFPLTLTGDGVVVLLQVTSAEARGAKLRTRKGKGSAKSKAFLPEGSLLGGKGDWEWTKLCFCKTCSLTVYQIEGKLQERTSPSATHFLLVWRNVRRSEVQTDKVRTLLTRQVLFCCFVFGLEPESK